MRGIALAKLPVVWTAGVVVTIVGFWLSGKPTEINPSVPSPQQLWLYAENLARTKASPSGTKFRVVLCWSSDDPSGEATDIVAEAFTHLGGFELSRDPWPCVSEPEAGDEWRASTREAAQRALIDWNADLAVMGAGRQADQSMNVWFVRPGGHDTLGMGHQEPYRLVNVRLQQDFHDELRAQIAATALNAASPMATSEMRGKILERGLANVGIKLTRLLEGKTITDPGRRAALKVALGDTLLTLGDRNPGTDQLEAAANAYTDALTFYARDRTPRKMGQNAKQPRTSANELGRAPKCA